MMGNYWGNWGMSGFQDGSVFGQIFPYLAPLLLVEVVLKGFALWKSARDGQTYWFIAVLLFNTLGILPLVYLLIYRDKK